MKLTGRFKGRETVKCPRCGEKCLRTQPTCHECGLVFSRLDDCTNKAAKLRLRRGEKQNVLMVTRIPADVKYWKLLLYSIVLGLCGGHYFYVHRWKMGIYMLFSAIVNLFFGVIFNAYFVTWSQTVQSLIIFYIGIFGFVWLYSIVQVIIRKFKIPVSLPYKEFKMDNDEEVIVDDMSKELNESDNVTREEKHTKEKEESESENSSWN